MTIADRRNIEGFTDKEVRAYFQLKRSRVKKARNKQRRKERREAQVNNRGPDHRVKVGALRQARQENRDTQEVKPLFFPYAQTN